MPGTNAGTGQPLTFRCAKCRIGRRPGDHRAGTAIILTGRRRDARVRGGVRMDLIVREYKCMHCGHVGWSRHSDLKRRERCA